MKEHHIEAFKDTQSVLMMKDYDEWCFLWALIRLVYPEERHTHYAKLRDKYFNKFDLRGITAPLTLRSISRLHKQNPWLNATFIFVYTDEQENYPYAVMGKGQNYYGFLFTKILTADKKLEFHFYAILDVDVFLTKKYDGATGKIERDKKKYFCYLLAVK